MYKDRHPGPADLAMLHKRLAGTAHHKTLWVPILSIRHDDGDSDWFQCRVASLASHSFAKTFPETFLDASRKIKMLTRQVPGL